MNKRELHTGVNGNGSKTYLVVTIGKNGNWDRIERFDNKAEAVNWIKWA